MTTPTEQPIVADRVLTAAAEIVTAAVQAAATAALRRAGGCGCRGCQATAGQTARWAAAMLHGEAPRDEQGRAGVR